jgi:hypothetical protein
MEEGSEVSSRQAAIVSRLIPEGNFRRLDSKFEI